MLPFIAPKTPDRFFKAAFIGMGVELASGELSTLLLGEATAYSGWFGWNGILGLVVHYRQSDPLT